MSREQEEQFEQDRLGNSRRKLDQLRARAGNVQGSGYDGIVHISSADTGSVVPLMSKPTSATDMLVTHVYAYNSVSTSGNTFSLYEGSISSNGSLPTNKRRSVPLSTTVSQTTTYDYSGKEFSQSIGVNSSFQGYVAVSFVSDHHEDDEPDVEVTGTPS